MLNDREVVECMEWIEQQCVPKLTEWEVNFMDSIRRQWDDRGALSEKQRDVLEKLFDRVTAP